jgi:hypothetical protein
MRARSYRSWWEDDKSNLKEAAWEDVVWIHMVQDMGWWRALVNTAMNILGPIIKGGEHRKLLTDCQLLNANRYIEMITVYLYNLEWGMTVRLWVMKCKYRGLHKGIIPVRSQRKWDIEISTLFAMQDKYRELTTGWTDSQNRTSEGPEKSQLNWWIVQIYQFSVWDLCGHELGQLIQSTTPVPRETD